MNLRYVKTGDVVRKRLPWSEVCMYMRVAGKFFDCEIKDKSVQLWKDNRKFSIPITHGEAGFYTNTEGRHWY